MDNVGKRVKTPFGEFSSCCACDRALGFKMQVTGQLVRNENFPEWTYISGQKVYLSREQIVKEKQLERARKLIEDELEENRKKGIETIRVGKDRL